MAQLGTIEIISNPVEIILQNTPSITIEINGESKSLDISTNTFQGRQGEQGLQGVQGLQGIQGIQGIQGKSAYQIAVENGFTGTEQEWLISLSGASNSWYQEEITITQDMINNKELALNFNVISPNKLNLSIFGGIEQRPLHDFYVVGNRIIWDSLALELLLEVGSVIAVRYNRG